MMIDPDIAWFNEHRDRMVRIRAAGKHEAHRDFEMLGDHDPARRRVIIVRVPDGPHQGALLWIPIVLFADDTIEDRDDVLMPIVQQIMAEARGALH